MADSASPPPPPPRPLRLNLAQLPPPPVAPPSNVPSAVMIAAATAAAAAAASKTAILSPSSSGPPPTGTLRGGAHAPVSAQLTRRPQPMSSNASNRGASQISTASRTEELMSSVVVRHKMIPRQTRPSSAILLQRHHVYCTVHHMEPVVGALCELCKLPITERPYFMCQRCTFSVHTGCNDRLDLQHKTCENYQELTVVDVVDNVEDSLRDKVARIDMLNKLIGDEISDIAKWTELSINNSKAQTKESVDDVAIKDVQQEIKLHEQKLEEFRKEFAALHAVTYAEPSEVSDEFRKYFSIK